MVLSSQAGLRHQLSQIQKLCIQTGEWCNVPLRFQGGKATGTSGSSAAPVDKSKAVRQSAAGISSAIGDDDLPEPVTAQTRHEEEEAGGKQKENGGKPKENGERQPTLNDLLAMPKVQAQHLLS